MRRKRERFGKENLTADDKWRSYDKNEKSLLSPCGIKVPNLQPVFWNTGYQFKGNSLFQSLSFY